MVWSGPTHAPDPITLKGDIATIVKVKPNDLEGALRELVTDSDTYSMQVSNAAPSSEQAGVAV